MGIKLTDSLQTAAIRALKNASGSYKTRHNHLREASRFVQTLRQTGHGVQKWQNLTNKHVAAVVDRWQSEGLAVSTIKEYLSGVRTVLNHFDNERIAPDNRAFGLENRVYVNNTDKSLSQEAYENAVAALKSSQDINDNRMAAQLMLQRTLGLRKEESFKFNPTRSVLTDGRIYITDGTKGGRDRMLHQVSGPAKAAIAYAKTVLSGANTMANAMTERQWNNLFYRTIKENGLSKDQSGSSAHGLRHAYAQERYQALTGFAAPVKFASREAFRENARQVVGSEWKKLDQDSRTLLKAELGHGPYREDVVSVYLGSA
jgi:site-specific recombinase XerD